MSKGKLVLMGMAALLLSFSLVLTACPTDGNNNEPPEPPEQTTYTVTFNVDGGSAVPNQTVEEGKKVTKPENPTKAGYTFVNWYKDKDKKSLWNFDTDVVKENTTLYAKWISDSDLAYVGVWRSNYTAYWLQADGTAWIFYSDGYLYKTTWSTNKIDGDDVVFNETQFTLDSDTYTKNTTDKKTPAAATGTLLGTWVRGSRTVELKADKTAVLTYHDDVITLNYCVETNAVYLLAPDNDNLVIVSISITDGKLNSFSKLTSDTTLAGIWKLTEGGQDYYWNLDKDGNGTFHTLGASLQVSFTVTEDKEIDGSSYTISGNTLTLSDARWDEETDSYVDVTLTKVSSVSGSGFGGDNLLHGTWKMIQGDETMTLIFKNDGTLSVEMKEGDTTTDSYSYIWKADGSTFSMYSSSFGSSGSGGSYTISGSSLSFGGMEFTRQ